MVVVIVDADRTDCQSLKREMLDLLAACDPRPETLFRIAIEEMEAWILGDRAAIKAIYPRAKEKVLNTYTQDSVCGTWELLADAIHPGGALALKKAGRPSPGREKFEWASRIGPEIEPSRNASPSFQVFVSGIRRWADGST